MVNNIFVAIIGLSLNTTNQLKSLFIKTVNDKFNITWTNIANTELNLIILNQNFIDSPAVVNLKNKNIPILSINYENNKENIIEDNKLFLPFIDTYNLYQWILKNIKTEITFNFNKSEDVNLISEFNNIYHSTTSNYFKCHINNDQILVIDKKMHEIWIQDDFKFQPIHSLNIEALNFDQVVNLRQQKKRHDLSLWLWNYLWSNLQNVSKFDHSTYYKLKYWPQYSKNVPKETLKLSSCFQHGANISTISKNLNINPELINKFIYIALACDLIQEIPAHEAKLKFNNEDNTPYTLRSFFSKMRKKLGI